MLRCLRQFLRGPHRAMVSAVWAGFVAVATSGCAVTFGNLFADPFEGKPQVDVSYVELPDRVEVHVTPSAKQSVSSRDWARSWGWVGDLAAGAAASQAVRYSSRSDALAGMAIGAYALVATDYYFQATEAFKNPATFALATLGSPFGIPVMAVALPFLWLLPEDSRTAFLHTTPSEAQTLARLGKSNLSASQRGSYGRTMTTATYRFVRSGTQLIATIENQRGRGGDGSFTLSIRDEKGTSIFSEERRFSVFADPPSHYSGSGPSQQASFPPSLKGTIKLETPRERNVIAAEKGGTLILTVSNSGRGEAVGTKARLVLDSPLPGLTLPEFVEIGDLVAGETGREVSISLGAGKEIKDATRSLTITIEDRSGFDAPLIRTTLTTKKLRLPVLAVDQVGVDAGNDGIPKRGAQIDVSVKVRNRGQGWAEQARVILVRGNGDILLANANGSDQLELGDIGPGMAKIASWSLFVRNAYAGPDRLPLALKFEEIHPEAAATSDLTVALAERGQRYADVVLLPGDVQVGIADDTQDVGIDVDQPLGAVVPADKDAVGLVIGIEQYNKSIPGVPYAVRDAAMVRQYLIDGLGVPAGRIVNLANDTATKGAIETAVEGKLPRWVNGRSHVYVYFAGHGAPDPKSNSPFIVPYDGDPQFAATSCFPLKRLYAALGKLGAKSVTVILDSCFSGNASRTDKDRTVGLLAGRPVAITAVEGALPPGLTVLAAASGGQISNAYRSKRHGLFTYYVLKGLRGEASVQGRVTVPSLAEYVKKQVSEQANLMLLQEQQPELLGEAPDRILIAR